MLKNTKTKNASESTTSFNSEHSYSNSAQSETSSSSLSKGNASTGASDCSLNKTEKNGKNKTRENSSSSFSNSGTRPKEDSMRHRVVQSRYKQAACDASKRLRNATLNATCFSSPSSSGSSRSSRENEIPPFKNSPAKTKMSKFSRLPNKINPPTRKIFDKKSSSKVEANKKLHSTALLSATLMDKTSVAEDEFSTTVVTRRRDYRNNEMTLPDLSEFSLLQPTSISTGCVETASEQTVISLSSEKEEDKIEFKPQLVTEERLQEEYLRYLTWAFIDIQSEDTYRLQIAEAEAQLTFLAKEIDLKEKDCLEAKKKNNLIRWYKKVNENFELLKDTLTKLAESSPEAAEMCDNLGNNLEKRLHQIKLEDIYIPDDQELYCQEMVKMLEENSALLDKLNAILHPRQLGFGQASETIEETQKTLNILKNCVDQTETLVSLAIQEASLKLTLNSLSNK